jgi:hypothetical protein
LAIASDAALKKDISGRRPFMLFMCFMVNTAFVFFKSYKSMKVMKKSKKHKIEDTWKGKSDEGGNPWL